MVAAIVISVVIIAIAFIAVVSYAAKNNEPTIKKPPKKLSVRQQLYRDEVMKTKSFGYSEFLITQATLDGVREFITRMYGDSDEALIQNKVNRIFGRPYRILEDENDIRINYPLVSLERFKKHDQPWFYYGTDDTVFDVGDKKLKIVFHKSNTLLYKMMMLYFSKKNIEVKDLPPLPPMKTKKDQYVILDKDTEEYAVIYYLTKVYKKERHTLSFYRLLDIGEIKTIYGLRKKAKQLHIDNEKDFIANFVSNIFTGEYMHSVIRCADAQRITEIRRCFNSWESYKGKLDYYRNIEKELKKEVLNK